MATFHHYQDLKDKLSKVFKNLASPANPVRPKNSCSALVELKQST